MDIYQTTKGVIEKSLPDLDLQIDQIHLEHPTELSHGDLSTNVAMQLAKAAGKNPRELADQLVEKMNESLPLALQKVEVAGPGFINFTIHPEYLGDYTAHVNGKGGSFGKNQTLAGQKMMFEYTDPNPFKVLHIGHLMSNTIGESLSRLAEFAGAEVWRVNYQGDVGMHVAKALWAMQQYGDLPDDSTPIKERVTLLGKFYAEGSAAYDDNANKEAIHTINKQVYDRSDEAINKLYDLGRQWSLDYFETQYKRLGTWHAGDKAFNYYFFESEVGKYGQELVNEFLGKGIFEESKGAIIFPGEKYGLHTRVFINAQGLPTYEAKELGLAQVKYGVFPYDHSIIVTGNEIDEYFKVLLKAMEFTYPELQKKTVHMSHGMLRLPEGKMSSRTGSVLAAEDMIDQVEEKVREKMVDATDGSEEVITGIAVGALKYSILRQGIGKDIIFDFEKSLSFEGDSGPYLQYTHARTQSILNKASEAGITASNNLPDNWETTDVERLLYRFPEVVNRALDEYAPHYVATYLIELARAFNSFYGNQQIIQSDDAASGYRVALTQAVGTVLKNGLYVLGITAPERM